MGGTDEAPEVDPVQVSVLLQSKGAEVVCVPPGATVAEVVDLLAARHIGAVVVSGDGRSIDGIVSDFSQVVPRRRRPAGLGMPVGALA
jgi:CBS domain-containing protein